MPKKKLEERDEQYILALTPNRTAIYINEATEEDSEAIFISFKGKETVFRINGDGVHISTDGNNRERISINNEVVIDGSSSIQVKGGNYDIFVDGDMNFKASGNINIEAEGDINLKAGGNINEDGSEIYLNSGMAESAEPVQTEVCKI